MSRRRRIAVATLAVALATFYVLAVARAVDYERATSAPAGLEGTR